MNASIIRLLLGFVFVLATACQDQGPTKASRYAPTDLPAVMPSDDFSAYIEGARGHVMAVGNAAGAPIPIEDAVALGPFELRPEDGRACRSRSLAKDVSIGDPAFRYDRGILLIHGLNDTPFSVRDLGHRFAKACYLVRALLLPGHGTVPGDLLSVALPAWQKAVKRAIGSFRGKVDRLVIAGFDLGANLALDAAHEVAMPEELELNGLVLLAPAFSYEPPGTAPAALGPGGDVLWGDVVEDEDALRYHAIARPGVAATNLLGQDLFASAAPRHLPLFMVASAEDAVADPDVARDWFCRQSVTPRHLLWYSRYPDAPFPACSCTAARRDPGDERPADCVSIRASSCVPPASGKHAVRLPTSSDRCRQNPYKDGGDGRGAILDLPHIALLASPANPRYGAYAERKGCPNQERIGERVEERPCRGPAETDDARHVRYGEASDGNLRYYALRRLSYNPDFDHMADRIIDFLKRSH